MTTTTIRVDRGTHARLVELSRSSGESLMATVSRAADALRRERFAHQVREEIERLAADQPAWADYVGAAEDAVGDGLA